MDKYEEEILIMDYFKDFYKDFPKGKLVKSESPDFILKVNTKKSIGIELTRLDPKAELFIDKIRISVQKKENKIKLYQRKKFNSIWLIIHTDFIEPSKLPNLQNKLDSWKFETRFNKVFLFDLFEKKGFIIK